MNDQGTESNSIASTVLGIVSLVISIIGGLIWHYRSCHRSGMRYCGAGTGS